MTMLSRHTTAMVLLALLAGGGVGYVIGRERVAAEVARHYRRFEAEYMNLAWKARDPVGWRRDSAMWAKRAAAHVPGRLIREIQREQTESHCAVTFLIPDTTYRWARLFSAQGKGLDGAYYGVGYAFKRTGFQEGDSVRVVIPNTSCQTTYFSFGLSPGWANGPPQLDVR
jgi:hypothetical protein